MKGARPWRGIWFVYCSEFIPKQSFREAPQRPVVSFGKFGGAGWCFSDFLQLRHIRIAVSLDTQEHQCSSGFPASVAVLSVAHCGGVGRGLALISEHLSRLEI